MAMKLAACLNLAQRFLGAIVQECVDACYFRCSTPIKPYLNLVAQPVQTQFAFLHIAGHGRKGRTMNFAGVVILTCSHSVLNESVEFWCEIYILCRNKLRITRPGNLCQCRSYFLTMVQHFASAKV